MGMAVSVEMAVEMAGIEPATATLAGRARYLSCHPLAGFGIICLGLPFHGAHVMNVSIIQPARKAFRDDQFARN